MQYEDLTGCLWTEEQDDEGYVYYVNANTLVSCQTLFHVSKSNTHEECQSVARQCDASDALSYSPKNDNALPIVHPGYFVQFVTPLMGTLFSGCLTKTPSQGGDIDLWRVFFNNSLLFYARKNQGYTQ